MAIWHQVGAKHNRGSTLAGGSCKTDSHVEDPIRGRKFANFAVRQANSAALPSIRNESLRIDHVKTYHPTRGW
jgi:hypothetical protein